MNRFPFPLLLLLIVSNASSQVSIADIQGNGNNSPYEDQTVSLEGAVTGVYKDGYFIRDASESWSGLYIYDPGRDPMPRLGDSLALTGLITEYYSWTEMKNISSYDIISSGNPIPEPVVLAASEIGEEWESCLLTVQDLECTDDNLGYGEWEANDGSGSIVINDMGVPYTPDLGQIYTITGNLSYSFGAYKLEPRSLDDIQIMAPVYFTEDPAAKQIGTSSIEIEWMTNTESSTILEWGYTTDLEMGEISVPGESLVHQVDIGALSPATVIYIKAISESAEGEAASRIMPFITASESSGEIRVAFNRTYTDLTFVEDEDLFTHALADTIIKYIGLAESTLDIAFYDFTDHAAASEGYLSGIAEAITRAHQDGIQVRLITDADVASAAPGGDIPRLDIDNDAIMHHKFIIVDHESIDNSWVVTGSTNPNYNNLELDFNNLISIQDQSLARGYLIEFNELWGSDGPIADITQSRSGSKKTDNSPHTYRVNGKKMELFFSPSDYTTAQISRVIKESESSVDFAIMAFTENLLGDAIVAAKNNGSNVSGIIDYIEFSGSEYNYLKNSGIDVLDYKNPDNSGWPDGPTLHHKFAVIDAEGANPIVLTGSHNWTASAESKNDENTLIIYDDSIADLYMEEYIRIRTWLLNPPILPEVNPDTLLIVDGETGTIDVLANDEITGEFELEIVTWPLFGTALLTEDNQLQYAPGEEFGITPDSVQYVVSLSSYVPFSDTTWVHISASPTGIYDDMLQYEALVFPNPNTGEFFIEYPLVTREGLSIDLFDIAGREIPFTFELSEGRVRICTSTKPGIYTLKLQLEGERRTYHTILIR